MFWAALLALIAIWVLGVATSRTMGGRIHLLPAVAVVLLAIRLTSWAVQTSLETLPAAGAPELLGAEPQRPPVVDAGGT